MEEMAVELRSVTKRFGAGSSEAVLAVVGMQLGIPNGEFFSLLGPSGCGKTTTLRMIAGFEMPDEGEILIQGESMGHIPPFKRPVNTVFQNYALWPHMNVFQNVAFGLEMAHVSKPEIRRRVSEAMDLVRLTGMDDRRPKQLSGGQQQRVALARALVLRPAVLLLDEPLGALDLKLRKAMQLELKHLQEQVGITFIYVTHDQEEALTMSDRIAVMDSGEVLQVGRPKDIYENPATRFVADFIGETNFLEGRVSDVADGRVEVLVDDQLVVHAHSEAAVSVGQSVAIALRPERTDLRSPDQAHDRASLPGRVEEVVYIGTDTRYIVRLTDRTAMVVRQQNLGGTDAMSVSAGVEVLVTWDTRDVRLLTE